MAALYIISNRRLDQAYAAALAANGPMKAFFLTADHLYVFQFEGEELTWRGVALADAIITSDDDSLTVADRQATINVRYVNGLPTLNRLLGVATPRPDQNRRPSQPSLATALTAH
jgi:hypothetical protein